MLRKLADRSVEPAEGEPYPLAGVKLLEPIDAGMDHTFSRGYVDQAIAEGWAELAGDRFAMHLLDRDLVWSVLERPGDRIPDENERAGIRVQSGYRMKLLEGWDD